MPPCEPLGSGEVRVLWASLEHAPPPSALDAAERARAAAMASPRAARGFCAARAVARELLSRCVPDVAPAAWAIRPEPGGRPRVLAPEGARGLAISISHGRAAVAAAVARAPVGVDVEGARRVDRALALAGRFFHPSECEVLAALPAPGRAAAFLDLWALKEALGKACGCGMAAVMGRAAFPGAEPGGLVRARWAPELGQELGAAESWRFRLVRLPGEMRLAAAVRGATGEVRVERYGAS